MTNPKRIRQLNKIVTSSQPGPVVYWMSRDQRVQDNWALLYAAELADKLGQDLIVIFCLRKKFPYATARMVNFMLGGLEEVEQLLHQKNIPFQFLIGDPAIEIPKFVARYKASTLVTDFSPLKHSRKWKQKIRTKISVPLYEVDAHNIVPCWVASPKQEFGAYTFRPKITKLLPEFLHDFPPLKKRSYKGPTIKSVNWKSIRQQIQFDPKVPSVTWVKPGERFAKRFLQRFIATKLHNYNALRNDPTADAQSNLSPYLHFGQLSAQRVALEVGKYDGDKETADAFLEELIVRRELSDNYCYYNSDYTNFNGFPAWAKKSLDEHRDDDRLVVYTLKQLEQGATHDELWNAAQLEMVRTGKMHGYMRMYWAKKILEWSKSPEVAQRHAIYLNDTYSLDGRDPNGYTGIAWSVGGVHDRAWGERPIFGKIRYMSYNGAKGKFDVKRYIARYGDG